MIMKYLGTRSDMALLRNRKEVDSARALEHLKKAAELLDGSLKHFDCSDRSEYHEKYVIEYGHSKKES